MLCLYHKNHHSLGWIIGIVNEVCASDVAVIIIDARFIDVGGGQSVVKPIARDGIEKLDAAIHPAPEPPTGASGVRLSAKCKPTGQTH
jgi:hypothetical protein